MHHQNDLRPPSIWPNLFSCIVITVVVLAFGKVFAPIFERTRLDIMSRQKRVTTTDTANTPGLNCRVPRSEVFGEKFHTVNRIEP